jgi:AcrR family transcriptional regulator
LTWTGVQLWNGRVQTRLPVAERRARLVDAALAVAAAEGIAAVTVRRVAEQAGVALGVVHYCFADKDELLDALAARIVDDLTAAGAAALDLDAADDLAGALELAVDGVWRSIEESAGAQLLTYEITTYALRGAALRGVAQRQYAVSQAAAERLLELAAAAGGATWRRPVPELAAEALAFVDGVTLRWLVDGDRAAARARLSAFAGYLAGQATHRRRRRRAS